MSNQKPKNIVSKHYLEYIPIPKDGLKFEIDEKGQVVLFQENKGPMYKFTQIVFKKPRVSQIHLDTMGNFIWPLMDGHHNVQNIADAVKAEFGAKAEPVLDRLVQYLQTLESYHFIEMMKLKDQ